MKALLIALIFCCLSSLLDISAQAGESKPQKSKRHPEKPHHRRSSSNSCGHESSSSGSSSGSSPSSGSSSSSNPSSGSSSSSNPSSGSSSSSSSGSSSSSSSSSGSYEDCPQQPCCPDGWLLLPDRSKCVFTPSNVRKSWINARKYCQNINSDLVSIHSLADNNFIYDMIPETEILSYSGFWIGGFTREAAKGNKNGWKWANGAPFDYKNWNNKADNPQPDNNKEYCKTIKVPDITQSCLAVFTSKDLGKQWDDNCCSAPQMFVCEKPVDYCVAVNVGFDVV